MDEKKPIEKAVKREGFDAPIADPGEGKVPDHINEHTLMVKGFDPHTKERMTVSLAALKHEFGDKLGLAKYKRIAKFGGFFDPGVFSVGDDYAPDLSLEGLAKDVRQRVDAVLKEA